ncbi:MAG: hypothetical protein ACR2IE_09205 [Candidatus Sumerlaeaceae bacterium]
MQNWLVQKCLLGLALCVSTAQADIPWPQVMERITSENKALAKRPGGRAGTYFVVCTLYYTPKESGFTVERGFDSTTQTKPGLGGRAYNRDFLNAVHLEGIGRLQQPLNGLHYIRYEGRGRFGYTSRPTGYHRSRLASRVTCATNRRALGVSPFARVQFISPWVKDLTGNDSWIVGDTGALRNYQVDLYWGEDEPMPGKAARPDGTTFEYGFALLQVPAQVPKLKRSPSVIPPR